MGKLFAPIIDKSITAFTDNSCTIKYYLPYGTTGSGVILRTVAVSSNGQDDIGYSYNVINSDSLKIETPLTTDMIAQLYLVSEKPILNSGETLESWLKNPNNASKQSVASEPVTFYNIKEGGHDINLDYSISNSKLIITGLFDFENTDILKYCNIKIKDEKGNLVEEKLDIYPLQENYIQIEISISNQINTISAEVEYFTIKGYTNYTNEEKSIKPSSFTNVHPSNYSIFLYSISYTNGKIDAKISIRQGYSYTPYLYRGYYDELNIYKEKLIDKGTPDTNSSSYSYQDNTYESGKLYSYRLLLDFGYDADLKKGVYLEKKIDNCISFFEDVYLQNLEGTKSLKVRFNPAIDSIKRNFKDTITATLGSDYPYITRAGKNKYRTFNLGGLITIEGDLENVANSKFLSASAISKIQKLQSQVTEFYDFRAAAEKIYREEVLNFLHSPDIKLFKSTPEGNIYVYLSNISLSVDKVSARNLQSFTCQATEVEDPYINEYTKYVE